MRSTGFYDVQKKKMKICKQNNIETEGNVAALKHGSLKIEIM